MKVAHPAGLGPVAGQRIASAMHVVRGQRVLLDSDIASLYGVTTKHLNQQVKRNAERFPEDFAFRLTADEIAALKSQSVTSNSGRGGRRYPPTAFTEHGALMLSSVLNSPTAVSVSIQVVRTFIELRRALLSHADLARQLDALEKRYDSQFRVVFQAIRELMAPPGKAAKRIGFKNSLSPSP